MSTEVGKLHYDLTVDDKNLKSGLDSADKQVQGFGTKVDAFGDRMTSAGKKMTLGMTVPLVGLATYGVKAFSDLGEAVNAVSVVFGESSKQLEEFATTASTQVGLSKRAFLQAATPIGAALQNVGYSADEAAEKSIVLTKRAADMASVFNVDVSEALTAINAGLRGESEPIKRFGVGLDEASIKAYALANGIARQGEEMTNAQKVQARYGLLMEQSNKVAGDFVNTSDSIANSQRIMKAQTEDSAAKLAQNLAPAVQKVQAEALKLLEKFNALSPAQQEMILKGAAVLAMIGPLTTAIGGLAKATSFTSAGMQKLGLSMGYLGGVGMFLLAGSILNTNSSLNKQAEELKGVGYNVDLLKSSYDRNKIAQDLLKQSTDLVTAAQDRQKNASLGLAQAQLSVEQASLREKEAQDRLTEAVNRYGQDSPRTKQAELDLRQAKLDSASASQRVTEATKEQEKATAEASKQNEYKRKIEDTTRALDEMSNAQKKIWDKAQKGDVLSRSQAKAMGMPGFSKGVENFRGGMALVGEDGPELVNLPKGSDVIPNHKMIENVAKPSANSTSKVSNSNYSITLNVTPLVATSKQALRDMSKEIVDAFNEGLRSQGKKEVGVW